MERLLGIAIVILLRCVRQTPPVRSSHAYWKKTGAESGRRSRTEMRFLAEHMRAMAPTRIHVTGRNREWGERTTQNALSPGGLCLALLTISQD